MKYDKGDHKVNRQKYLEKIFSTQWCKINNCKIQSLSSLLKTKSKYHGAYITFLLVNYLCFPLRI